MVRPFSARALHWRKINRKCAERKTFFVQKTDVSKIDRTAVARIRLGLGLGGCNFTLHDWTQWIWIYFCIVSSIQNGANAFALIFHEQSREVGWLPKTARSKKTPFSIRWRFGLTKGNDKTSLTDLLFIWWSLLCWLRQWPRWLYELLKALHFA